MNERYLNDLQKAIKNQSSVSSELAPGVTPRRYVPNGGERKHRERIHRESAMADSAGNLPFSFHKPYKPKRQKMVRCCECGFITYANINTVGMICRECSKFVSVEEVVLDE